MVELAVTTKSPALRVRIEKEKSLCRLFLFSFCSGLLNSTLRNTSLLTREVTKVVDLRTTNLTVLVHNDALNKGAIHREDTLNAYVTRHFANGKTLLILAAVDSDYIATELLDTLFVTLFNTISHSDLVTGLECRKFLFLTGKCLFGNFHQIHF